MGYSIILKERNILITFLSDFNLMAFGDNLNDKRNFNRRSPSRRDKGCNYKKQQIRRL